MRYGKPKHQKNISNDTFEINKIKFDFRNKYKYKEETKEIAEILSFLELPLNLYLESRKVLPKYKDSIEKYCAVHIALTDLSLNKNKSIALGNLTIDSKTKEIILIIRVKSIQKTAKNSDLIYSKFIKVLVHEIFHLFFDKEDDVKKQTKIFINKLSEALKKVN